MHEDNVSAFLGGPAASPAVASEADAAAIVAICNIACYKCIMFLDRDISGLLAEALSVFPVVCVTGPRQVGKSTLLRNAKSLADRFYVDLDPLT